MPLGLRDIHHRNWFAKTLNNPFTGKSRVAFSHVSLFCPNSLPGSYEQGCAQNLGVPYVQNWRCEDKGWFREFICKTYWGWLELSLYLFHFFFPLWKRCGKSNISWRHLFWNCVIPCTSKITSLTEMLAMGTCSWSKRDISLPCCLPAAVQQGSYHRQNVTINLWIRDTHRHRLLRNESALAQSHVNSSTKMIW